MRQERWQSGLWQLLCRAMQVDVTTIQWGRGWHTLSSTNIAARRTTIISIESITTSKAKVIRIWCSTITRLRTRWPLIEDRLEVVQGASQWAKLRFKLQQPMPSKHTPIKLLKAYWPKCDLAFSNSSSRVLKQLCKIFAMKVSMINVPLWKYSSTGQASSSLTTSWSMPLTQALARKMVTTYPTTVIIIFSTTSLASYQQVPLTNPTVHSLKRR